MASFTSKQALSDDYNKNLIKNEVPWVHVIDYIAYDCNIYAIGVDDKHQQACVKLNTRPGLYVLVKQLKYINILKHVLPFDVNIECLNIELKPNDTGAFATLFSDVENFKLIKIHNSTFKESVSLYYSLQKATGLTNYIKIPAIFNINTFIMFEMYNIKNSINECVALNVMIDKDFNIKQSNLTMNVCAFDIETVSSKANRIPMGEYMSDVLFSFSLTDYSESTQYCCMYIPNYSINYKSCVKRQAIELTDLIHDEEIYPHNLSRKIELYSNEIDLLKRLLALFTKSKFYIMLGYNSKSYDMQFVYNRAMYYQLDECEHFYNQNGILTYGTNMLHIDMYLIFKKFYSSELPSLKLDMVSRHCLPGASKVDFSAVQLRFIFKEIETNGVPHDGFFEKFNVTLSKLAHYNDIDSILVFRLWLELKFESFLTDISQSFFITWTRIMQSGVSEYLSHKIMLSGISENTLFVDQQNIKTITGTDIKLNQSLLASMNINETSYGGGFNMRDSKNNFTTVFMCDYVAYYPYLIEGFNISPDTVSIIPVNILRKFKRNDNVILHTFNNHKSTINDAVYSRLLLDDLIDNGREVDFDELQYFKPNDLIIVLVKPSHKEGILSKIMKNQNQIRDTIKNNRKEMVNLQNLARNKKNNADTTEDDEDDDDDFDFDEYDDDNAMDIDVDDNNATSTLVIDDFRFIKSRVPVHSVAKIDKMTKDELDAYVIDLGVENTRMESQYRNLKIVNSSIYGCLGANYGVLKNKTVAAVSTYFGRRYIIETAKQSMKNGYVVCLIDTDSTFIVPRNINQNFDICKTMKSINHKLELNKKVYNNVYVLAKKVYIATKDGDVITRGMNKNGPINWTTIIETAYDTFIVNKTDLDFDDLYKYMLDIFNTTYEQIKLDPTCVSYNINIKDVDDYKTVTPACRLMRDIQSVDNTQTFGSNIRCYNVFENNCKTSKLGIEYNIHNAKMSEFNLFKFYKKTYKRLHSIFTTAITNTSIKKHDCYIYLNYRTFETITTRAFMDAREKYIK